MFTIITALSFGPPIEIILALLVLLITITVLILLMIFKWISGLISWGTLFKIVVFIPLAACLIALANNFITSPMKVTKWRLQGTYVINRNYFKGNNANWQYEHYWLQIKGDEMYLNVMDKGKLIKQYRKPIEYKSINKHTFLSYSHKKTFVIKSKEQLDCLPSHTRFDELELAWDELHYNSDNHHMLVATPLLHADPFSFNVVLPSTKYNNMYFKKGRWRNSKRENPFIVTHRFLRLKNEE